MVMKIFDEWIEKERLPKHGSIDLLKGSVIGVDAAYFAKQFLVEPLLTALGGAPIALESFENAVQNLTNAGISLHFVFNGLNFGKRHDIFAQSQSINLRNASAFTQYEEQHAEHARRAFQALSTPTLDGYMHVLMASLHRLGIGFTVAPYSALAQLACYERDPSQFLDAIFGPTDLFYFGVEKIITAFSDTSTVENSDKSSLTEATIIKEKVQFTWIDRSTCLRALGGIQPQLFTEALIIIGTDLLPQPYPPLEKQLSAGYNQPATVIREAVNYLMSTQGNLSRPLEPFDAAVKADWLGDYKRVMAIIKYHVVLTADGDVETLRSDQAPVDTHDCIGLRLPQELYMYLSRGAIGLRVLNWLTLGTVIIPHPLAGAEVLLNRTFASKQMDVLRKQAICLVTEGLHRYFQNTEYRTYIWSERNVSKQFKPIEMSPSPRALAAKWNVRQNLLESADGLGFSPGSLAFGIHSLRDANYAARTVTPRTKQPLQTKDEVLANIIWRFLHLRDFIDDKHQLTRWGNILEKAFSSPQLSRDSEQSVFLAVELLRYGVLDASPVPPENAGSPLTGSSKEKEFCTLVARVASLGRLRHRAKGYSGPLSRSLLAYHSLISALQLNLRDLLEATLISSLLEGHVSRERDDWMALSTELPFYEVFSCGLGIAVQSYLDHLGFQNDPTDPSTREHTRAEAQKWIQYSNMEASLDDAFWLWDAVYSAIKNTGELDKERLLWDETNAWLSERR